MSESLVTKPIQRPVQTVAQRTSTNKSGQPCRGIPSKASPSWLAQGLCTTLACFEGSPAQCHRQSPSPPVRAIPVSITACLQLQHSEKCKPTYQISIPKHSSLPCHKPCKPGHEAATGKAQHQSSMGALLPGLT